MSDKSLLRRFLDWSPDKPKVSGVVDALPWEDLLASVGPDGLLFVHQTMIGKAEQIAPEFTAYARQVFKANPIVFACVVRRIGLFSEARFKFRNRRGKYFGTNALAPLETPWPNGTTSDLLALAELYVSIGGNFFATRRAGDRIRVMRPDWVGIVLGSESDPDVELGDLDAEVIGYMYAPGGPFGGKEPVALLPENVCHYMPRPDPEMPWRGMSWMSAIIEDVRADKQATTHKLKYWENGATPNMIVRPAIDDPDEWDKWVERFRREHEGVANRYKTLFLAMGVEAEVVGTKLAETDIAKVQSVGEVRICAVAEVPPSVAGVSEGLQGSALNAGNYEAAFRQFANNWARPAWKNFTKSIEHLIDVPADGELWYDDRDIPALQEDVKKVAETQREKAATVNTLITAGYTPESAIAAVETDDFSLLQHTGLVSVQLRPPGQEPAAVVPT